MTSLLARELTVIVYAYLLAGIPVGAVWVTAHTSPTYQVERAVLLRWWSRMALLVVLSVLCVSESG